MKPTEVYRQSRRVSSVNVSERKAKALWTRGIAFRMVSKIPFQKTFPERQKQI